MGKQHLCLSWHHPGCIASSATDRTRSELWIRCDLLTFVDSSFVSLCSPPMLIFAFTVPFGENPYQILVLKASKIKWGKHSSSWMRYWQFGRRIWGYMFCSRLSYVVVHENDSSAQNSPSYFKLAEMWAAHVCSWVLVTPPNRMKMHQTDFLI